jgi:putative SOS response-associated peptidase YedK
MCLNFIASTNTTWINDHFALSLPKKFDSEIYPGYYCPIIRAAFDKGVYQCDLAHFGLIPPWTKDIQSKKHSRNAKSGSIARNHLPRLGKETYNARSETVNSKPSFRMAWNYKHFALVIVDGFFQPNYESGTPVRWFIKKSDGKPFALACLWDRWANIEQGKDIISFSILTKDASSHPLLKRFHRPGDSKRMPIIILEKDMSCWLEANLKTANELISNDSGLTLTGDPAERNLKPSKLRELD